MFSVYTCTGSMDEFGELVAMKHMTEAGFECFPFPRGTPYFDYEAYKPRGSRHYAQVKTRADITPDGAIKVSARDYNLFYPEAKLDKAVARAKLMNATILWVAVSIDAFALTYDVYWGRHVDLLNPHCIPMSLEARRQHWCLAQKVFDPTINPGWSNILETLS